MGLHSRRGTKLVQRTMGTRKEETQKTLRGARAPVGCLLLGLAHLAPPTEPTELPVSVKPRPPSRANSRPPS